MGTVSDTPRPPLTTTTSIWPAAMIAVVGVTLLAVFLLVDWVTSRPVVTPSGPVPVVVGGLAIEQPLAAGLTYCNQPLEVPQDLVSGFVFPVGTTPRPGSNTPNLGAGDFDCVENLATAHATSGEVLGFYRAHLPVLGWSLFSTSPSPTGHPQYLFQRSSSDGFYWEIGVTIRASTPGHVRWSFTLFQNSQTV